MKFIDGSGLYYNTIDPNTFELYEQGDPAGACGLRSP